MGFQRVGRGVLKGMLVLLVVVAIFPFVARGAVVLWAREQIYSTEQAPAQRVALVLGARVYRSGRLSAMLADRVAAAVELYHAGKVDALLMSGDNSRLDYNEPDAMRARAVELGVPADDVFVDYGGRRTYDSCYRARYIFGVEDTTVVTQNFHLPRALMLCRSVGIEAVGVGADDQRPWGYSERSLTYSQIRELPATLLAIIDAVRQPQPPVMGEPMPILQARGVD